MLNKLDDFPIHQTPEPIAHAATTDRNAYDRTWMNGYNPDGSYFFGAGIAIYPHRRIMDCAFSVVKQGGEQYCFYASRRAPLERTETSVGPFSLEMVEPMRKMRLVITKNETGIECDLTFTARTAAIEEARHTLWHGNKKVIDTTRFDQFGRWQGTITYPEGTIEVDEEVCMGTKDRSWGVRNQGEPETGGAPVPPQDLFFLWAPLIWEDHVSHAIFFDDNQGRPLVREGIVAPTYKSVDDIPGVEDGRDHRMATARHRIKYVPGTRRVETAEIDLIDHDDTVRTIKFEPLLRFQMKGIGYMHPEWGQGMWKGELAIGSEHFNANDLDPLLPQHLHVQQIVRVTDGTRTGTGVLEHVCIGRYAPSGFTEMFDGAKG